MKLHSHVSFLTNNSTKELFILEAGRDVKRTLNGICSSVVEHWSGNPEDAGSIPSRKALELHFSQLVPVWVL